MDGDSDEGLDLGTARQWAEAGVSPGRLRALVRRRELIRERHGTYVRATALAAVAEDPAGRHALDVRTVLAATSAPGAVASHESAALIHGLPLLNAPAPGTVTLTRAPGAFRGSSRPDVRYYSASLPREHVTTKLGAPVTTVARTVIDLARTLPFMDAVVVADVAIHKQRTSKPGLSGVLGSCKGWPGADAARRVVAFSDGRSNSVLESCARVVFDANGLPPPELQVTLTGGIQLDTAGYVVAVVEYHDYVVDFYWPDFKTIAETDGKLKYSSGKDAIKELKRDRLLRMAGYQVVHLTWDGVFYQPEILVHEIRRAFAASSPY